MAGYLKPELEELLISEQRSDGAGHIFGSMDITTSCLRSVEPQTVSALSHHPRRLPQGWRQGVSLGTLAVTLTLILNVLATIAFVAHYGSTHGLSTLYTGSCTRASRLNLVIHLVINILSTLLLASSNYCMQVLNAPTRGEIDKAHASGKWCDIGLSSVRNLGQMKRWRVQVWALMLLSSLPLHLVYNSVVFSTVHAFQYTAVVASPGFLTAPTYNGPVKTGTWYEIIGKSATLADVQRVQADSAQYVRLENADCMNAYSRALVTDRSDLILITISNNASDDQSYVFRAYRDGDFYTDSGKVAGWIDDTTDNAQMAALDDMGAKARDPSNWILGTSKIDHCLSRPEAEKCTVRLSFFLIVVVVICNVLKLVGLLVTLFAHKERPIVTLGDAVASFMASPDPATAGGCLLSQDDVKSGKFFTESLHVRNFMRTRVFLFHTVSGRRWWWSVVFCLAGVTMIAVLLDLAIIGVHDTGPQLPGQHLTLKQLWDFGFGLGDGTSFWLNAPKTLYGNIIIANLPQVVFSILYFLYNGLYTSMCVATEWASFASQRKGLRVSRPRGAQRSTYYLQLPMTYAIPLIAASTVMHWLISQSFFVLAVNFSGTSPHDDLDYCTCGYSPIAIIFGLGLAGIMVTVVVLSGFRRVDFGIPIVGGCSLAISAACHPLPGSADATEPLQWGVVEQENEVGHCAFSAGEVGVPIDGAQYAGDG